MKKKGWMKLEQGCGMTGTRTNTIPEVVWGLTHCRPCNGKGWWHWWGESQLYKCDECQGTGEMLDVIEVKDGNEVAEDE